VHIAVGKPRTRSSNQSPTCCAPLIARQHSTP
jgi:hypothetical protein